MPASGRKSDHNALLGTVTAVQVDEVNEGRFVEFNSLLGGDFLQRAVNVGQMVCGDVAHEGAGDFVVAHAAVQPAEKQDKLHKHRHQRH